MNFIFIKIAHADSATDGISSIIGSINKIIINPAIRLLFLLALIMFFWGIVEFINKDAKTKEALTNAKNKIFYGLIGMTIMFSVWGIMNFLVKSIGADKQIDIENQKAIIPEVQ